MSSENQGYFDSILQVILGTVRVIEGTPEHLNYNAKLKLCKLLTPRQTEELISKLREKYQPPVQIRDGLARDPNRKLIVRIIRVLLLNQNGVVL
jgi:hypothetical protein